MMISPAKDTSLPYFLERSIFSMIDGLVIFKVQKVLDKHFKLTLYSHSIPTLIRQSFSQKRREEKRKDGMATNFSFIYISFFSCFHIEILISSHNPINLTKIIH